MTDTLTVTSVDGTASETITVTINGTNDGATISGSKAGTVSEDGAAQTASGTLTVADVDTGENHFQAVAASDLVTTYGTFAFNPATGVWGYTLNNDAANVQALKAGQSVTDTLTVTSVDGTASETITVTINGTNDGATISGSKAGTVSEDGAAQTASGTLTVADVNTGETTSRRLRRAISSPPGTFAFNPATGVWGYTLNNDAANVQALKAGQSVTDTLTVTSVDGTASETITVTINGTNDGATISGSKAGTVSEDGAAQTASGTLTVADVDTGENHFQAVAASDLVTTYGTFAFNPATGVWGYTLNNDAANVQALKAGQSVTDTLTVTSVDGTASETITVTINGTNDGATISGSKAGTVSEDGAAQTASGTLTVADVDTGENHFQAVAASDLVTTYGTFAFNPATVCGAIRSTTTRPTSRPSRPARA